MGRNDIIILDRVRELTEMILKLEMTADRPDKPNTTAEDLDLILRPLRKASGNIAQLETIITEKDSEEKVLFLFSRAFLNYGEAFAMYRVYKEKEMAA